MSTILIADDNSNIQKMVTLAFKDEGINVVAVGNGEAAVRKAPELMPDLVLADIFMPVRNGYEVCEFMKQDTRLAHVPVVLLIGAFDPFDEREAQRVGADGVLKKPFVPPEPLVNLVKELLAKSAAEQMVPVSVAAAVKEELATSTQEKNSIVAPPVAATPVAPREADPPPTAFDLPAETGPEEVRPFKGFTFREDPDHSGKEGGASAFGSFLDAATEERVESPDVNAPLPNHSGKQNDDAPTKGYSGFSSWLSKTPALDAATANLENSPAPIFSPSADRITRAWDIAHASETRPEDETVVEPLDRFTAEDFRSPRTEHRSPAEEEVETNEFENEPIADATPEISAAMDAHAEASVEPAVELTTERPIQTSGQSVKALQPQDSSDDTQTIDAIRSSSMPWHSVPSAIREMHSDGHEAGHDGLPWFGAKPADEFPSHDSLPQHEIAPEESAGQSAKPFAEEWNTGSPDRSPVNSGGPSFGLIGVTDLKASVDEALADERETLDGQRSAESLPAVISSSPPESVGVPSPQPMNPQQLEEIITRVVERMQPQVLDVITREILRPVVEALVRRQLEMK